MNPEHLSIALKFLSDWQSIGGPCILSASHPDTRGMVTQGMDPEGFIRGWNGTHNVYFQINPDIRHPNFCNSKAGKRHISRAICLHSDLDFYKGEDPAEGRKRGLDMLLNDYWIGAPGPPSVLNFSGNGLQPFWLLREPVEIGGDIGRAEEFERYLRGIAGAFGGDHTTDVCRVFRVPGTLNLPNAVKRARGLVPVLAQQILFEPSRRYDLADFPRADKAASVQMTEYKIGPAIGIESLDELARYRLSMRVLTIIRNTFDPANPGSSRSEPLFVAVLAMVGRGVPDEVIKGVLLDGGWGISDSVLEQRNPERYAERQIFKAHARIAEQISLAGTEDEPLDFSALSADEPLDFSALSADEPLDFSKLGDN